MTLPLSGPITFSDINTEANFPSTTRRGINDFVSRNLTGNTLGQQTSMSDFYGKTISRVITTATYTTSAANVTFDPLINLSTSYIPGYSDVTVRINSNVYIWSTSTSIPAMTIKNLYAGDTLTIEIAGYILGCGGSGSVNLSLVESLAGGTAIDLNYTAAVNPTINMQKDNAGVLGGGGGAGGTAWDTTGLEAYGGGGAGGGYGGGRVITDPADPDYPTDTRGIPGAIRLSGTTATTKLTWQVGDIKNEYTGGGGGGRYALGTSANASGAVASQGLEYYPGDPAGSYEYLMPGRGGLHGGSGAAVGVNIYNSTLEGGAVGGRGGTYLGASVAAATSGTVYAGSFTAPAVASSPNTAGGGGGAYGGKGGNGNSYSSSNSGPTYRVITQIGGDGGKAINLNGHTVTIMMAIPYRIFGAVA